MSASLSLQPSSFSSRLPSSQPRRAPKTASKRVFLITDSDDPHAFAISPHALLDPARTTLKDLTHAGVAVEPFFISGQGGFDINKFYSVCFFPPPHSAVYRVFPRFLNVRIRQSVLLPTNLYSSDLDTKEEETTFLPESISITRIDDLLSQMRFHEVPKRAQFSIALEMGDGWVVGVKGCVIAVFYFYFYLLLVSILFSLVYEKCVGRSQGPRARELIVPWSLLQIRPSDRTEKRRI